MSYQDKLSEAQANFVTDIVSQIPTDFGARDAFVAILDTLATGPEFRFYIASIFSEDVKGNNDEAIARELAGSEDDFVIDTQNNLWLMDPDDGDKSIVEVLRG